MKPELELRALERDLLMYREKCAEAIEETNWCDEQHYRMRINQVEARMKELNRGEAK